MLWRLDLWDRFRSASFWWMHLMICLWLLFAFILFIAEPLILHRHFRQWATGQPAVAFAWLHWAHWVLLALSVVTILGAVAGSQLCHHNDPIRDHRDTVGLNGALLIDGSAKSRRWA